LAAGGCRRFSDLFSEPSNETPCCHTGPRSRTPIVLIYSVSCQRAIFYIYAVHLCLASATQAFSMDAVYNSPAPPTPQNCTRTDSRDQGLADTARHVIGCRLTQETRVQRALDDMAGTICQALPATPARWRTLHRRARTAYP
jgi:hypothetical protein